MTAEDLSAARALDQAAEQTGLSDLGDDSWQEGLERLVDGFRNEAALNELGAALVGGELVGYLGDRMLILAYRKAHPEIVGVDVVPPIALAVATNITEVQVMPSQEEIAEEQIKDQEKQRVMGFIPNFYVSYVPNAVPLNSRQKFRLALKTSFDPVTFGLNGASAGIQQATNSFSGYGQGVQGYAKRYGASYADFVTGTFIGSAILPSLLKQDPRYFYKGTGSKRSRILYAIANAVICKGDNGNWQPNYSSMLGSVASAGISNSYYPAGNRGVALTFENALMETGENAAGNLLQEFLIRKLTPNLPNHQHDKS